MLESHNVIIIYTIPVSLEWETQYQFDIEETWGWNKECMKTQVRQTPTKSRIMGKKCTLSSSDVFTHIEFKHSEKRADLTEKEVQDLAKDYTLERLKGMAWFDKLPMPKNLPKPIN